MKVYVDELPKSCEKCKFYEYEIEHNGEWGFETHRRMCKINGSLIQGICPLQSLADYTKQVRKEVLGELMNMLGDRAELIDCGGVAEFMFTTYDLSMCVEEILGEKKGETECQKN